MLAFIRDPRCQSCTATCNGNGYCFLGQGNMSRATVINLRTPPPDISDLKESLKYNQCKGDRKDYWKSPVERKYKRGKQ